MASRFRRPSVPGVVDRSRGSRDIRAVRSVGGSSFIEVIIVSFISIALIALFAEPSSVDPTVRVPALVALANVFPALRAFHRPTHGNSVVFFAMYRTLEGLGWKIIKSSNPPVCLRHS